MGLKQNDATVGYLVDLIAEVQIVRSCIIAAEHDPQFTPTGYCVPNHAHLAAGGISLLKARQLMSELLRIIPGSSLVMAPTEISPCQNWRLRGNVCGADTCAAARSACSSCGTSAPSSLDGRLASSYASGGMPGWRARLRRSFKDYNSLANTVLKAIDPPMPAIDVASIGIAPVQAQRRVPGK
jgi:4-hydroxyphenylacetate 3-monooxygenase